MFFRSDRLDSLEPEMAEKVPGWTHSAEQISIGGRIQVLEDGNDVCNSESDSDNDDHGSDVKDAHKDIPTDSHGDPLGSGHKVSTEQANAIRASSKQANSQASRMDPAPEPVQERKATPMNSDEEDQNLSYDQQRAIEHAKKSAARSSNESSRTSESTDAMPTRSQAKKASGAGCLRSGVRPG
jgi:hypothetical protein